MGCLPDGCGKYISRICETIHPAYRIYSCIVKKEGGSALSIEFLFYDSSTQVQSRLQIPKTPIR